MRKLLNWLGFILTVGAALNWFRQFFILRAIIKEVTAVPKFTKLFYLIKPEALTDLKHNQIL